MLSIDGKTGKMAKLRGTGALKGVSRSSTDKTSREAR